ncbi:MAG: hypothetical protein PWP76_773, partial [Candidatus Diapherotrites archaeon]|nr:hypothetical protein [Candidatus Diapherotrites archaeon]
DNVHRFLGLEPKLKELRKRPITSREEAMRIHDDLVRHLTTWEMPGTMATKEPFVRRERTKNMLKAIVERHYR